MSNRINDDKELFIQKHYVREPELFLNIRKKAKEKHCEHMMVAPSEARLLQSLVEIHGANKLGVTQTGSTKILEIGTLFGYTAIYLAQGIWGEGKVWTLEKSEESAEIARGFISESAVAKKIEVVQGDAHENLKNLEQHGPFDCIFIDADKAGYPDYLNWAEKNLKQHGMIIADNTILGGSVWSTPKENYSENHVKRMMEFHERFSDPKKFRSLIYPSFDGIAVGIKL